MSQIILATNINMDPMTTKKLNRYSTTREGIKVEVTVKPNGKRRSLKFDDDSIRCVITHLPSGGVRMLSNLPQSWHHQFYRTVNSAINNAVLLYRDYEYKKWRMAGTWRKIRSEDGR